MHEHEEFFLHRLADRLNPTDGIYPLPGTICCFLSHYYTLRRIHVEWSKHQSPESMYLVLEDDCVFDDTVLPTLASRSFHGLPKDWSILKHSLGKSHRAHRVNKYFFEIAGARGSSWDYYSGTHFVIYNGSKIAEVIRQMETQRIYDFDGWLREKVDGVFSFSDNLHIKQSNLGGSNTNPQYASAEHEDRSGRFPTQSLLSRVMKLVRAA